MGHFYLFKNDHPRLSSAWGEALRRTAQVRPILSTLYILGFELFCMAVVFRARFGGPPYDGPKETEAEFFLRTEDDDLIYRFRSMNEARFFLTQS